MSEERTLCRTPTSGKKPTTIPTWKYVVIRKAILKILPKAAPGVRQQDLAALIAESLDAEPQSNIGSIKWHTVCVKLNMECDGEIARVPDLRPQHLIRLI